jgi:hypothetical protein
LTAAVVVDPMVQLAESMVVQVVAQPQAVQAAQQHQAKETMEQLVKAVPHLQAAAVVVKVRQEIQTPQDSVEMVLILTHHGFQSSV